MKFTTPLRTSARAPRHLGFTLVELLVVMAIISLLVALLLPGLSSARDRSKAVSCQSNMKMIWSACRQYAMENREYMCGSSTNRYIPEVSNGTALSFVPWWSKYYIGEYLGVTKAGSTAAAASEQNNSYKIFYCPSQPPEEFKAYKPAIGLNNMWNSRLYTNTNGTYTVGGTTYNNPPARWSQCPKPNQYILLIETYSCYSYGGWSEQQPPDNMPGFRHGNVCNVVTLDGSTASIPFLQSQTITSGGKIYFTISQKDYKQTFTPI